MAVKWFFGLLYFLEINLYFDYCYPIRFVLINWQLFITSENNNNFLEMRYQILTS